LVDVIVGAIATKDLGGMQQQVITVLHAGLPPPLDLRAKQAQIANHTVSLALPRGEQRAIGQVVASRWLSWPNTELANRLFRQHLAG
jgi:hypothetical protein